MYHSITFLTNNGRTKYNTWSDWHLIPASRPTIAHPEMTLNYITIPGRKEPIDITGYLYKNPIYKDRTGSFTFYVIEGYEKPEDVERKILAAIHGKRLAMIIEDEPGYYYIGRFTVDDWRNEANRPRCVISYTIEPYKYNLSNDAKHLDGY